MTRPPVPPTAARLRAFALRAGVALLPALLPAGTCAQTAPGVEARLLDELARMQGELARLRDEVERLKRDRAQTAPAVSAADGVPIVTTVTIPAASAPRDIAAERASPLSVFGYGELNYARPTRDPSQAVATARRGVIGLGYRFDERTRVAIELEIEDAIASASDRGEVAFEQLYVEHDLTPSLSAKAGLFLLPVGYLNEVHEPTRYYGVTRNFVETAIIPTTWRELGIGLRGTTDAGLRWDAGLVTGFDLGRWDAGTTEGRESPLGAIHQEGSQARARSLAAYAALNWNGRPGVNLGGSVYAGGAGHKQADFAGADASITLAEAHARWSPGRLELTALSAAGRFRNIDALNATFAGQSTPIPARFGGSYVQAAYRAWDGGPLRLVPFARYERFDTAAGGFPGLPTGLAPATDGATRVWTAGASLYLNPQVVLKLDYQRFLDRSALDRLNLGVGFHF
ncbi:MAG: hypothetical protein WCK28_20115 [Burkholderiales bacterium]|jgi:hypothetical protein